MQQALLMEKYPVFYMELGKDETTFSSVDEIIAYFKENIDAHPIASYIAIFDHYTHTKNLPDGKIAPHIHDAKNIVFCFGIALPDTKVMAVRPRSIGVCETDNGFDINFMEAPMPLANTAMEKWAKSLRNT